eukprot:2296219-Prymnesium_polylepis.3
MSKTTKPFCSNESSSRDGSSTSLRSASASTRRHSVGRECCPYICSSARRHASRESSFGSFCSSFGFVVCRGVVVVTEDLWRRTHSSKSANRLLSAVLEIYGTDSQR